jgi:hypothetical protein
MDMSMDQNAIENYVKGCIVEAQIDYIPLWGIAAHFERSMSAKSNAEIKEYSLITVQQLIENNILPGSMSKGRGFDFWTGTTVEKLARVESEWPKDGIFTSLGGCWLALKK